MTTLGNYLARIAQDPEQPLALRVAVAELERLFGIFEVLGIVGGARFQEAYRLAFEQYAPACKAPNGRCSMSPGCNPREKECDYLRRDRHACTRMVKEFPHRTGDLDVSSGVT